MARRIALEDGATEVFVWVDDGYQRSGVRGLQGKVGANPVFRDREVMTLLLRRDFLPLPGETPCLAFLRAHSLSLFPRLLRQSPCHRWARCRSRQVAARRDTPLRPVWRYRWDKSRRDCTATADCGVCARRQWQYFGDPRVLRCTWEGVPVAYDRVTGDTGFMGKDGPRRYREARHRDILTPVPVPPAVAPFPALYRVAPESARTEGGGLPRRAEHRTPSGTAAVPDPARLEHLCFGAPMLWPRWPAIPESCSCAGGPGQTPEGRPGRGHAQAADPPQRGDEGPDALADTPDYARDLTCNTVAVRSRCVTHGRVRITHVGHMACSREAARQPGFLSCLQATHPKLSTLLIEWRLRVCRW